MEAQLVVWRSVAMSLAVALGCIAPFASAEERHIPALDAWLVINERGPENSDAIVLEVQLLTANRQVAARFPPLIGPVYVSAENRQLFSCESNATQATEEAQAYALDGAVAFSFGHQGFLRSCGLTGDERLYWLHYNLVRDGAPVNSVIVLDRRGSVIYKSEFTEQRTVEFAVNGVGYTLSIPAAELPG